MSGRHMDSGLAKVLALRAGADEATKRELAEAYRAAAEKRAKRMAKAVERAAKG